MSADASRCTDYIMYKCISHTYRTHATEIDLTINILINKHKEFKEV